MRISTGQYQQVSLASMLEQQAKLSRTQQQLATGRRVLTPADDPVAAARALDMNKALESLKQYQANANHATLRLNMEETALEQSGNVLQRVRELTVQANNATIGADERKIIAAEVRQRLEQLVQIANGTDGNGEYLFTGTQSRTQPFVQRDGAVTYQGDQGERMVQIGPTRQVTVTHSGFDVFMRVPNGSGEVLARPEAGNSGTARLVDLGKVQPGATPGEYRIEFAHNAAGELVYGISTRDPADPAAWVLQVPDAADFPDAAPLFEQGEPIAFNGIEVRLTGEPAAGDGYAVGPSRSQSIFATLQNLLGALEAGDDSQAGRAAFNDAALRALSELDQGMQNLLRVRAEVGSRLNAVESEMESGEVALLDLQTSLSQLQDLDYAEAITKLNLQLASLQASQQSYLKVQGLTLFNYI